jgi:hypothetical protein
MELFIGIAVVGLASAIGYFVTAELPDFLKNREKTKLDVAKEQTAQEQERTAQGRLALTAAEANKTAAEANLATARLTPPGRTIPVGSETQDV